MLQNRGFNFNQQNLKRQYDYIIVGQGLAGSCLALELSKIGNRIIVFDDPQGNNSSKVAGGLINPITGRKMVLTWKAHELFPFLEKFYKDAEQTLAGKFYFQTPIYRPFVSIEEQNEWQGKSVDISFKPFIEAVKTKKETEEIVNDPFGGLLLKKSGYLDTKVFLNKVSKWLESSESLINEKFDIDYLNFIQNGVVYKDIEAKKVIFCDGVEGGKNPYFQNIKFRPVKGEVLKIKMDEVLDKVYNRGLFVMPRNGSNTVGSNYNHKDLSWEPTVSGKQEIENKLKLLLLKPFRTIGHIAGVRPSIVDRRPVLGNSQDKDQLVIFNGLGTKGVSLAPFFANHLVNWLCNGHPLDEEINVSRFYKSK